jgi:hypothetical protein
MYCKVLKLATGETIIGSVETESATYVDVHRPIKILIAPRGEETFNVVMIKWDPTVDFNLPVRVFKSSIVSVAEPANEFRKSYLEIYEEYEQKTSSKDKEEDLELNTVDDLSAELEKLVSMMKNSSNTTYH